jgi:hypothetical protein
VFGQLPLEVEESLFVVVKYTNVLWIMHENMLDESRPNGSATASDEDLFAR